MTAILIFILKVFLSLLLSTWQSELDKVRTEIQELSSIDCNFQGLSRCVWTLRVTEMTGIIWMTGVFLYFILWALPT